MSSRGCSSLWAATRSCSWQQLGSCISCEKRPHLAATDHVASQAQLAGLLEERPSGAPARRQPRRRLALPSPGERVVLDGGVQALGLQGADAASQVVVGRAAGCLLPCDEERAAPRRGALSACCKLHRSARTAGDGTGSAAAQLGPCERPARTRRHPRRGERGTPPAAGRPPGLGTRARSGPAWRWWRGRPCRPPACCCRRDAVRGSGTHAAEDATRAYVRVQPGSRSIQP
jgi:hypothetical protein